MAAGGTRALDVLRHAGVEHVVHEYAVRDASGRDREGPRAYGDDAAAALGVNRRRIHKTLVASVDSGHVIAIVPVARELDLKALADAAGGRRASMADPVAAERVTGYVRGGISPLGQRRVLPTIIDIHARDWPTVYVSAGRRGLQVELAPADLVRLTGARVAAIAK